MHSLETLDTLTVCEPCQHCSVSMASVVLECSCSVPRLRILMCNDPFIPLDYMVYQLKYDSVHGRFNGTIAMSERIARNANATRGSGCHRLGNHWFRIYFFNLCLGRTCRSQRRALSIGFRSVPYYWYAHVHGPWRRTQVLPASREQHHHDRRGGNDRLHAASAAFDGWRMSHIRQSCTGTPRHNLGEPFLCSFSFCFLWLSFPALYSP